MSEFDIITHYFSSLGAGENVRLSVGDDAAALRVDDGCELLVSTDTSAAGVHFPEDLFPEDIAYKAVAAAASGASKRQDRGGQRGRGGGEGGVRAEQICV